MLTPTYQLALVVIAINAYVSLTSAKRRIFGGWETEIDYLPWMVFMTKDGQHQCGGSLISENYVLTAAHCVQDEGDYGIKYGTSRPFDIGTGTIVNVAQIHMHPQFDGSSFKGTDIAILELAQPVIFSASASPVTLREEEARANEAAVVGGWGTTEAWFTTKSQVSPVLLTAVLSIIDFDHCRSLLGKFPNGTEDPYFTRNYICAFRPGKGSCSGDSGGPLVIGQNQVGIVSWGPCGDAKNPSVYTNVMKHRYFIDSTTKYSARWTKGTVPSLTSRRFFAGSRCIHGRHIKDQRAKNKTTEISG